jgi:iron-sulfur cluster insertion protein
MSQTETSSLSSGNVSSSPARFAMTMSDSAAKRIAWLMSEENDPSVKLRLSVQGGGCSGFQYSYDFDTAPTSPTDFVLEKDGAILVVDDVSIELLNGSMLDYVESLAGASFEIKNPNATSGCGCGNSFSM